jgi:putative transcriptional regulator
MAAAVIFVLAALAGTSAGQAPAASTKSFLLVASRNMPDPVFQQSVILMLPPDEPPLVAGVIINKPTDVTLGNLFKAPLPPESRNQKVCFGGPVDLTEPLLVLRTSRPPKAATHLWADVYEVAEPDSISSVLQDSRVGNDARLYLGRAQWAQDQLRGELLEGAWSVLPVRTDLIFTNDSAKIWPLLSQHEHVREIGVHCLGTGGVLMSAMCSDALAW